MIKRFRPLLSELFELTLLWACLLVTFHFLPADRPVGSMLLAITVIRLLLGVSSRRAWLASGLVVLVGGLVFYFVWSRGPDTAGLGAWFILSLCWRRVGAWLRTQASTPRLIRELLLKIARGAGRILARVARYVMVQAVAPWTRYLRLLFLLFAAVWFMRPYLTKGVIGADDALWYSNVVTDFIRQVRAGIFPVWVGQTYFSFLGGTFPIRMAPYLQHLAGVIDLLTGRHLSGFVLLNLALTASFAGALFSCYFCLGAVLPHRPWTAFALAFLYATCPGVIGLAYAQDLYMSFTALPFLPLVFLGIVRSFERDDAVSRLLIGGGLAAVWLAHPPIALWCGIVTTASQAVRLYHHGWSRRALLLDLLAVAAFIVLAGYSFVSVASLGPRIVDGSVWQGEFFQVQTSFPGNWLPLPRLNSLEDLQLGYGLAAVFAAVAVGVSRRREPLFLAVGVSAAVIFVMLVPIPMVTALLWHLVPPPVLRMTKTWPMQRLMILLALCTVFSAALLARHTAGHTLRRRWVTGGVLFLAVCWSGWEASRLAAYISLNGGRTRALSARMDLSENVFMTRSTLGVAPKVPRWFSNSVMDPAMEHYFLAPKTRELRASASDAVAPGFGPGPKTDQGELGGILTGTLNSNPGVLDLSPELTLEPRRKYLLLFQFLRPSYTGLLLITGPEFRRVYELPANAGPWAFAMGAENSHLVSIWTSLDRPETVQLQFVPTAAGAKPMDYTPFARFELRPYEPRQLSIQLESLMPYRATVRSPAPALLETPRLFVPGYIARVDGASVPVQTSDDGLVLIPVQAGNHAVALDYVAPLAVRLSYWIGLAGWAALLVALFLLGNRGAGGRFAWAPVDN